jgi:hypothetical protein
MVLEAVPLPTVPGHVSPRRLHLERLSVRVDRSERAMDLLTRLIQVGHADIAWSLRGGHSKISSPLVGDSRTKGLASLSMPAPYGLLRPTVRVPNRAANSSWGSLPRGACERRASSALRVFQMSTAKATRAIFWLTATGRSGRQNQGLRDQAARGFTICQDNDDTQRFEVSQSALPLLSALLILVLPDRLGPLALDRPFVVLRPLRGCEPGLIGFTSTFGEVANLGRKTGFEVQVGTIR